MTKKIRANIKKQITNVLSDAKRLAPEGRLKDVYTIGAALFVKMNKLDEKETLPIIEEVWKSQ